MVAGLLRRVLKDRADIDLGSRPALPQPFWGSSVPFRISGSRLPQGHESEVDSLFMVAANYKGLSLTKRKVAFSFACLLICLGMREGRGWCGGEKGPPPDAPDISSVFLLFLLAL